MIFIKAKILVAWLRGFDRQPPSDCKRGTDTSSPSHPDLSENALIGSPGDNPKKQPLTQDCRMPYDHENLTGNKPRGDNVTVMVCA
jgi:hypothetical protein